MSMPRAFASGLRAACPSGLGSTSASAVARPSWATLAPRQPSTAVAASFSTSSTNRSHVGSLPLPIPSGVSLTLPSELRLPTDISPTSPRSKRAIGVSGPLGSQSLDIPACTIIEPPTAENGQSLSLSVHDSEHRDQKSLWGLTRALLANTVTGVSEGFRLPLRLVGVGYRGAVEPIPESLRRVMELNYTQRHGVPPREEVLPKDRLNMKLGYAHPIYVNIPPGITVTTPQPSRIILQGIDKQQLGLFAEKIRRWRKPEPYRGKGIFVGDETIKLKEIKKK